VLITVKESTKTKQNEEESLKVLKENLQSKEEKNR
jgi:hypothetical protein